MFGGRDSSRSTWRWCSCSSAASSIVTIRSLRRGSHAESAFSSVVLPEPVPPEMRMFSCASTQRAEEVDRLRRQAFRALTMSSSVSRFFENFRIVSERAR